MNFIQCCLLIVVAAVVAGDSSTVSAQYTLTTLASFNGTNGDNPSGSLLADASGNLYGTTYGGGASGDGTLFEVAAGTHTLSTLVTFNGANGSNPFRVRLIADASGNLYGTTTSGGSSNDGTLFELAAGTHTFTTLVTFNGTNGANPRGGLLADAGGNIYGTTFGGGDNGNGTVFEIAAGTHAFSTLDSFNSSSGPNGTLLADAGGNLYGTTYGTGAGTVFEIAAGTHALNTLATFNGSTNGAKPYGGLIADANGNLYGTTEGGGANTGAGTVFELVHGTDALITLANFTFNDTNGANPQAELLADASGNLYSTTYSGGINFHGTVFEVAASTHTLSTLAIFNGTNGGAPDAGLIADASGNLYGTTYFGGANTDGTVFELSPVPEPSSLVLAGCGLVFSSVFFFRRKAVMRNH